MRLAAILMPLLLVLLAIAPAMAATEPAVKLTPQEQEFLRKHGPLRVVLGATGAPLNFNGTDGRARGIHLDLLSLMTVRLGIDFSISFAGSVNEMQQLLEAGHADVAGGLTRIPAREDKYAFTESYYAARIGFWVSDRHPTVQRPQELDGLTVATPSPAFVDHLARAYPMLNVIVVDNSRVGALMLSNGTIDGLYAGFGGVGFHSRELGLTNLRTLGEPDQIVDAHWVTLKTEPMVTNLMAKAMSVIPIEDRQSIYLKWVGLSFLPPEPPTPFYRTAWFGATAGLSALVATFLVVSAVLLRIQVNHRTRQLRTMEQRLASRTAELETALVEVESFNYSVSHDLRTPIRSITGFLELLNHGRAHLTDDEQRRYLRIIEEEARHMARVLEALLELSRLTRDAPSKKAIDVSGMATEILQQHAQREPQRRVQWQVEPGLAVMADPNMTRVVLENLISNAWKFTSRQDQARIEVGQTHDGALFVRDNGAGFDPKSGPVFQPFRRFHPAGEFDGTGIGLATVYRIMMRHGGRIWVQSAPNQGTSFYLDFPREDEIALGPAPASHASPAGTSVRS